MGQASSLLREVKISIGLLERYLAGSVKSFEYMPVMYAPDPEISFLGIYCKGIIRSEYKDVHMHIFIAASFYK